jgi:hypothetical protein
MTPQPRRIPMRALTAIGAATALVLAAIAFGPSVGPAEGTAARPKASPFNDASVFGAAARPIERVPQDEPERGLVYKGLKAARSGPCVGGYEINGTEPLMCTHGPDAPPSGVDVKHTTVAALPAPKGARKPTPTASKAAPTAGKPAATAGKPAAASSSPARAAAAFGLPVCEGDGVTGRRVEVLYVHGTTSRYAEYLETFRTLAEGVDTIYNESAKETGGERHVRYVTENINGACRPVVRDVQIADSALNANDWAPLLNAVKAAGYTRTDRKYLEFVDSRVYCGIGGFAGDTRKSDANRSNSGPEYARADSGCWNAGVASHELGHTLGAVNNNAPNGSGFAHCVDEFDVMCYKDDASTVIVTKCPDRAHDQRLDCNHDDYYNTNPSPGSYLATNYNVADNLFLIKGAGTGTTTGPPVTTAGPTTSGPTTVPTSTAPGGNRALTATASTSYVSTWESLAAVNDGFTPTSSADRAHPVYGNWPQQGTQWVQYTWPSAVSLNRVQAYWFDDDQGIDLPASCSVQYWTGSAWQNVPGASACGVAANTFNTVTFTAVSTTQIRLNFVSRSGLSTGLIELTASGP